jgi:arylsulfatase A-like enzyme
MDPSWAKRFADAPVPQGWPDEAALARMAETVTGPFTATGQFPDDRQPPPLMPREVRTRADYEHMVTGYDAAIAYTDYHLGIVLDELSRQGDLGDTAVIVTADHGDAFGEHGIYSDHVCADECIHHVPLVVRWPGCAPAGAANDGLHYTQDVAATLCDMVHAGTPGGWDGRSFERQVEGQPGGGRDELVWSHGLYTVQRAIRTDRHLLVRTYDDHGYRFDPVELYDMETDPYQTRNLAEEQPQLRAELLQRMAAWVEEQRALSGWRPDPLTAILHERGLGGLDRGA